MSASAPQFQWGHININVSNLERSMAFYQLLGFEVFMPGVPYLGLAADPGVNSMPANCAEALGVPADSQGRACIMQLGPGFPKIDLTEFAGTQPQQPPGNTDLGLVRLCLATDDLSREHARLRTQGVVFLSDPQPGKDGLADIAVCADPDGTLIELIQVYMEKWQALAARAGGKGQA